MYRYLQLLLLCTFFTSCAYRVCDSKARNAFDKEHIPISFKDFYKDSYCIHYAEVCSGITAKPTLFFIHGSPASWYCYENYMRDTDLLRNYRIIAIDRPGFGYSDFGKPATVSMQAELVGGLVTKLQNGKPFYIIGHSLGGPLAVKIAAQHRAEVNGLVLLAAAVSPGDERTEIWRRILMPADFAIPAALRTCNREIWWFKDDVLTLPADLHSIRCRVVIFQGLADHMVEGGNGFYAQKELCNAASVKLVTYDEGHHDIPWTQFYDIKQALLEWK